MNHILDVAEQNQGAKPIDHIALADMALKGERAAKRNALAKRQTASDLGARLRRRRPRDKRQLVLPGVFDGFIKIDAGYVLPSQLPTEELHAKARAKATKCGKQGASLTKKEKEINRTVDYVETVRLANKEA